MKTNIFRVLILKPLQLLACLLVVKALTLKLRLKVGILSAQGIYLRFQIRKLVFSKRKLLAEYRSRTMLGNQLLNAVEDGHSVVQANVQSSATATGNRGFDWNDDVQIS
jgi:hypothetical protein